VVRRSYGDILREALHKPENYGKWTINIEINEGEKKMGRRKEENGRKNPERKTRNKSKTKPLKIKPEVFQKALSISLDIPLFFDRIVKRS